MAMGNKTKWIILGTIFYCLEATSATTSSIANDKQSKYEVSEDIRLRYSNLSPEKYSKTFINYKDPLNRDERKLNFDNLNELLAFISVDLPPIQVNRILGGFLGTITLKVEDQTCTNFYVDSIKSDYTVQTSTRILTSISASGFAAKCDFKWSFDYGVTGSGEGSVTINDSSFREVIAVESDNFNLRPPKSVSQASCTSDMKIDNVDIRGLTGANALKDTIDDLFASVLEDEVKDILCPRIVQMIPTVESVFTELSNTLDSYAYDKTPEIALDPLSGQNSLVVPEDMNLVDLTDIQVVNNDPIINAAYRTLNEFDSFALVDHPLNSMIRDSILDSNGLITYTPEQLNLPYDGYIFKRANKYAYMAINIETVEINGFDSITKFSKFEIISPQTLRADVNWAFLEFKVSLQADVWGSPASNAHQMIEKFDVTFEIENIETTIAILSALDGKKLEKLNVDSVVNSEFLFPCVLSTKEVFDVTELQLKSLQHQNPTAQGFSSAGNGELFSSIMDALYTIYGQSIYWATPHFFATHVQDLLRKILLDYVNDSSNLKCPEDSIPSNGNIFLPEGTHLSPVETEEEIPADIEETSVVLSGSSTHHPSLHFPSLAIIALASIVL